jgi:hypothetical protein
VGKFVGESHEKFVEKFFCTDEFRQSMSFLDIAILIETGVSLATIYEPAFYRSYGVDFNIEVQNWGIIIAPNSLI